MTQQTRHDASENALEAALWQLETETVVGKMLAGALERTANGTYGRCSRCLRGIATVRLRALPWVEFCAACQDAIDSAR